MAQQVRFFVRKSQFKDVLETLDGYDPPNWKSLKAAMVAYWGQVDTARFTLPDLEGLVQSWISKGGVTSVVDYQDFRRVWEPIQSYLLRKAHIDSVEEVRTLYYRSLSPGVQERVRDHLIKAKTMITTLDNQFKLPNFEILKTAVAEKSNDIMQKIEQDRRPKAPATSEKPPVTVDDISKMLQSFEQQIEKKFLSAAVPSGGASSSKERGPMADSTCGRLFSLPTVGKCSCSGISSRVWFFESLVSSGGFFSDLFWNVRGRSCAAQARSAQTLQGSDGSSFGGSASCQEGYGA
ncbi:hypothetical protein PTTG_06052 [Puccinia triticina 1-1 BBBD Race 1]|uniref:Uncharacterized protein n=1 Tax=Puccinia triticina (isolate 1-1 / race 1 (BBBD)) TaxID=630390 RepID=A0A180FXW3_PUCT1|nr:hypothetical protein PTTG_06052 [Puccinia triticina 1-1 BBBD Race 1]